MLKELTAVIIPTTACKLGSQPSAHTAECMNLFNAFKDEKVNLINETMKTMFYSLKKM